MYIFAKRYGDENMKNNQLEKILQEIEEESCKCREDYSNEKDVIQIALKKTEYKTLKHVEEIIKKHMTDNDGWVPVEEGLPDEHKSVFARYKNTFRWDNAMFETCSNNVNVTIEDTKGNKTTAQAYTADGEWRCNVPGYNKWYRIVAWKPLPEPYCREKGKVTYSSMQDTQWPEWREKVMGEFLKRE